jgi:hypothetical protein
MPRRVKALSCRVEDVAANVHRGTSTRNRLSRLTAAASAGWGTSYGCDVRASEPSRPLPRWAGVPNAARQRARDPGPYGPSTSSATSSVFPLLPRMRAAPMPRLKHEREAVLSLA